jgi:opacity protein-like surface antigen
VGPRVGMNINSGKTSGTSSLADDLVPGENSLETDILSGKKSFYIGAVAGIRFLGFRADLEYGFRNGLAETRLNDNLELETINAHNIFVNLYYNVLSFSFIKAYVNGGIGNVSFVKNFNSKINSEFAWLLGFGLNFSLFEVMNLDFGYRYVNMGKLKLSGAALERISNDIFVGLRFGF